MYPSILNNAYLKPSYKNPYYFITNHSDIYTKGSAESELEQILNPCSISTEEPVFTLEIRCGDTKKYIPSNIYIDYIKTPDLLYMDYDVLTSDNDNSQVLEFPEYVCYEIQNELTKLILENIGDSRLQTNIPINQTISGTSINE